MIGAGWTAAGDLRRGRALLTKDGVIVHVDRQGLIALLTLNILEGFDVAALSKQPVRYYHTLIEATKLAFADRNRYIADPAFSKVPVVELLSKDYAAKRRALINPNKAFQGAAHKVFDWYVSRNDRQGLLFFHKFW